MISPASKNFYTGSLYLCRMTEAVIRKAIPSDIPQIMKLIRELALFEKAPHEVTNTEDMMLADGFGQNPAYTAGVAEINGKIVGIYVWYIRYSTWKGKGLYLEDIVVTESMRGKGLGDKLIRACMDDARSIKANFMTWQVLDWNQPAINFYKKYNATFDGEWVNVKLLSGQF